MDGLGLNGFQLGPGVMCSLWHRRPAEKKTVMTLAAIETCAPGLHAGEEAVVTDEEMESFADMNEGEVQQFLQRRVKEAVDRLRARVMLPAASAC